MFVGSGEFVCGVELRDGKLSEPICVKRHDKGRSVKATTERNHAAAREHANGANSCVEAVTGHFDCVFGGVSSTDNSQHSNETRIYTGSCIGHDRPRGLSL